MLVCSGAYYRSLGEFGRFMWRTLWYSAEGQVCRQRKHWGCQIPGNKVGKSSNYSKFFEEPVFHLNSPLVFQCLGRVQAMALWTHQSWFGGGQFSNSSGFLIFWEDFHWTMIKAKHNFWRRFYYPNPAVSWHKQHWSQLNVVPGLNTGFTTLFTAAYGRRMYFQTKSGCCLEHQKPSKLWVWVAKWPKQMDRHWWMSIFFVVSLSQQSNHIELLIKCVYF